MIELNDSLKNELREYMKVNKLTQREIAERMGVHQTAMNALLLDRTRYRIPEMLVRVADVLGYEIKLVKKGENNK